MGFSYSAPQCAIRRGWRAAKSASSIWILAVVVAFAGLIGGPSHTLADDAVGSINGDIYHRKGWIMPAIYSKPKKAERSASKTRSTSSTTAVSAKTKKTASSRKKSGRKALRTKQAARRPSSKLRSAAKTRPSAGKKRRSAKGRSIPARIVKRRERKLKRTTRRYSNRKYAIKVASLGVDVLTVPKKLRVRKSVTGGSARIHWAANSRCVPGRLRAAIAFVARNFGRVRVNSTCRSRRHNRRVGGASRSWHLKSRAADIRVFGNIRKTARYLRRVVGGFKHYGGGLFHIDTGPRRSW